MIFGKATANASAMIITGNRDGSGSAADCREGNVSDYPIYAHVSVQSDVRLNEDPNAGMLTINPAACGGYNPTTTGAAMVAAYKNTGPSFAQAGILYADGYRPNIGGETHVGSMVFSQRKYVIVTWYKLEVGNSGGCEQLVCAVDSYGTTQFHQGVGTARLEASGSTKLIPSDGASIDMVLWLDGGNVNPNYSTPLGYYGFGDSNDPYYFWGVCSVGIGTQDINHPPTATVYDVIGLDSPAPGGLVDRFIVLTSGDGSISAWRAGSQPDVASQSIPTDTPVVIQLPFQPSECRPFSLVTTSQTVDPSEVCILTRSQLDIDNDGIITYNDRYEISRRIGQSVGSPGYLPQADVLFNGVINLADYQQYSLCWAAAVPCFSDIAGPGQSSIPDGELTADDIIVFFNRFFRGDLRVDVAGPGQSSVPDGELTADDIIFFLNNFFRGCALTPHGS